MKIMMIITILTVVISICLCQTVIDYAALNQGKIETIELTEEDQYKGFKFTIKELNIRKSLLSFNRNPEGKFKIFFAFEEKMKRETEITEYDFLVDLSSKEQIVPPFDESISVGKELLYAIIQCINCMTVNPISFQFQTILPLVDNSVAQIDTLHESKMHVFSYMKIKEQFIDFKIETDPAQPFKASLLLGNELKPVLTKEYTSTTTQINTLSYMNDYSSEIEIFLSIQIQDTTNSEIYALTVTPSLNQGEIFEVIQAGTFSLLEFKEDTHTILRRFADEKVDTDESIISFKTSPNDKLKICLYRTIEKISTDIDGKYTKCEESPQAKIDTIIPLPLTRASLKAYYIVFTCENCQSEPQNEFMIQTIVPLQNTNYIAIDYPSKIHKFSITMPANKYISFTIESAIDQVIKLDYQQKDALVFTKSITNKINESFSLRKTSSTDVKYYITATVTKNEITRSSLYKLEIKAEIYSLDFNPVSPNINHSFKLSTSEPDYSIKIENVKENDNIITLTNALKNGLDICIYADNQVKIGSDTNAYIDCLSHTKTEDMKIVIINTTTGVSNLYAIFYCGSCSLTDIPEQSFIISNELDEIPLEYNKESIINTIYSKKTIKYAMVKKATDIFYNFVITPFEGITFKATLFNKEEVLETFDNQSKELTIKREADLKLEQEYVLILEVTSIVPPEASKSYIFKVIAEGYMDLDCTPIDSKKEIDFSLIESRDTCYSFQVMSKPNISDTIMTFTAAIDDNMAIYIYTDDNIEQKGYQYINADWDTSKVVDKTQKEFITPLKLPDPSSADTKPGYQHINIIFRCLKCSKIQDIQYTNKFVIFNELESIPLDFKKQITIDKFYMHKTHTFEVVKPVNSNILFDFQPTSIDRATITLYKKTNKDEKELISEIIANERECVKSIKEFEPETTYIVVIVSNDIKTDSKYTLESSNEFLPVQELVNKPSSSVSIDIDFSKTLSYAFYLPITEIMKKGEGNAITLSFNTPLPVDNANNVEIHAENLQIDTDQDIDVLTYNHNPQTQFTPKVIDNQHHILYFKNGYDHDNTKKIIVLLIVKVTEAIKDNKAKITASLPLTLIELIPDVKETIKLHDYVPYFIIIDWTKDKSDNSIYYSDHEALLYKESMFIDDNNNQLKEPEKVNGIVIDRSIEKGRFIIELLGKAKEVEYFIKSFEGKITKVDSSLQSLDVACNSNSKKEYITQFGNNKLDDYISPLNQYGLAKLSINKDGNFPEGNLPLEEFTQMEHITSKFYLIEVTCQTEQASVKILFDKFKDESPVFLLDQNKYRIFFLKADDTTIETKAIKGRNIEMKLINIQTKEKDCKMTVKIGDKNHIIDQLSPIIRESNISFESMTITEVKCNFIAEFRISSSSESPKEIKPDVETNQASFIYKLPNKDRVFQYTLTTTPTLPNIRYDIGIGKDGFITIPDSKSSFDSIFPVVINPLYQFGQLKEGEYYYLAANIPDNTQNYKLSIKETLLPVNDVIDMNKSNKLQSKKTVSLQSNKNQGKSVLGMLFIQKTDAAFEVDLLYNKMPIQTIKGIKSKEFIHIPIQNLDYDIEYKTDSECYLSYSYFSNTEAEEFNPIQSDVPQITFESPNKLSWIAIPNTSQYMLYLTKKDSQVDLSTEWNMITSTIQPIKLDGTSTTYTIEKKDDLPYGTYNINILAEVNNKLIYSIPFKAMEINFADKPSNPIPIWVWIIVGIIAVLIIGVVIFFIMRKKTERQNSTIQFDALINQANKEQYPLETK